MAKEQTHEVEIAEYIAQNFKEQFDARLSTVKVFIKKPFVLMHLLDFSFPTEEVLLRRNEIKRVMETRDLLLEGWKAEMQKDLASIIGEKVGELYADWNLEKKTGLLIAVMEKNEGKELARWPENEEKRMLVDRVRYISQKTEKVPEETEIYWLNDYMVLIERSGIMVEIEKELIKNGSSEELRLAKRLLEHRLMESLNAEAIMKKNVKELFVDWDFEGDKAYMVLILEE